MNKKIICVILNATLFIGIFLFHLPVHADLLFTGDYAGGNFAGWEEGGRCCSYSSQIVTSPVRAGNYAARFELHYANPIVRGGKRSEITYSKYIGQVGGSDEWYGFSLYLPPDYTYDERPEAVAQWHASPDPGEVWRSPVLDFQTRKGNWRLHTRYSSKPIQTAYDGTQVILWEAPYQTGVWTDWVVHVKWSYQSDGITEIWKDGVKIIDYKGPNCYNDQGNIYFKWGVYKWAWNNNQPSDVTQRIVYNDELRIGDSNSSYAEVAPPTPDNMAPSKPTLVMQKISQR